MDRFKAEYSALSAKLLGGDDSDSDTEPSISEGARGRSRSRSPSSVPRPRRRRLLLFIGFASIITLICGGLFAAHGRDIRSTPTLTGKARHYVAEAFGTDPTFIPPPDYTETYFLPHVAPYNVFKTDEPAPRTPVFIGFTRNHKLLEQAVLSFIAAGWPRREIIVVDNSGTMNANRRKLLSQNNPFYLDYEKLTHRYGVNVLRTPTLLSFAQLQNFLISLAMEFKWEYYYWAHMDIVVLSDEEQRPYKSAYQRIVDDLHSHLKKWNQTHKLEGQKSRLERRLEANLKYPLGTKITDWGMRYYAYDWITLVNTAAMEKVGAWDTFIPYYTTDCDFTDRMKMSGLELSEGKIGKVFDVAEHMPAPESALFPVFTEQAPGSEQYHDLKMRLEAMENNKKEHGRNFWQNEDKGGKGEPWTYDPAGFHTAWWAMDHYGRELYNKKWKLEDGAYNGCHLVDLGKTLKDAW